MTGAAHLTSGVLLAVLGAALLHALWNSLVKSADDKFLSSALVALWCGVAAFAAALVLPWPSRAAPFDLASALIHIVYFLLVGRLYRNADLSVAYPIMRGLAPLIAALIALATLGEAPGPVAVLGIVILALFAFAYNAWADALTALAYAPIVLLLRGRSVPFAFVRDWRRGLAGGLAAFVGYAVVIWAMTQAPIAAVAALRETSVVFAALISSCSASRSRRSAPPPRWSSSSASSR